MKIGTRVAPGERVRAEHHNEIIDFLEGALQFRSSSRELNGRFDVNGLSVVFLGNKFDWFIPARITAVHGSNPDLPANVTYDVVGLLEDGAKLISATPFYGRPVKGNDKTFTKIRPAAVGSFCFILRDRDVEGTVTAKLVLLPGGSDGECLFYEQCSANRPAADEGAPKSVVGSTAAWIKSFFGLNG